MGQGPGRQGAEDIADKAEIVRGEEIDEVVSRLNQRGYNNLYIDGGRVIQSFLREDLIDEMIITKVPILLGDGIPLFDKLDHQLRFRHKKTETYNNILVKSSYTRDR